MESVGEIVWPLQTKGKARTMRLKGYGDAICAEAAAAFVRAYMEVRREEGLM